MHHSHHTPLTFFLLLLLLLLFTLLIPCLSDPPCRDRCGTLEIHYPFGIHDGCGAPQFRHMLICNTTSLSLFFVTPNGNYKVQSIDYKAQTLTVYDPDMSTCTILQPHHDLVLSDLQYAVIPPSPDTVFALLNCSVDSPILHRYHSFCFDFSGHKCEELYSSCNSFRVFTGAPGGGAVVPGITGAPPGAPSNFSGGLTGEPTSSTTYSTGMPAGSSGLTGPTGMPAGSSGMAGPTSGGNNLPGGPDMSGGSGSGSTVPPCCFTGYSTVKVMSMDILDCTHYTSFYDVDKLRGVGPMDWSYGVKFSYSVPDMGCERCVKSGGSCGFDAQTEALLCLCASATNSTRYCGTGSDTDIGERKAPSTILEGLLIGFGSLFLLANAYL